MSRVQLRGEKLLKHIEEGIKKLAAEADGKYTYNASKLSEALGVSRPTLGKHIDLIEKVLKDISANRRFENGQGVIQLMQEKIERLEFEKESLKNELGVLRNHHSQIYLKIYHHAADLKPLIRPIVEEEFIESERCILCQQQIAEDEPTPPKPSKVIQMPQRPKNIETPKK